MVLSVQTFDLKCIII